MFPQLLVLIPLAFASAADDLKNSKRSIISFGLPSWNSGPSHNPWQTDSLTQGPLYPISSGYSAKGSYLGLSASTAHDIAAAVAAAKEATAAAALAHQKVHAAREQVVVQERVAAAKDAAAHAAIQRSEAAAQVAAAIQKSEALAAAAAAIHKSAAAAAHAVGHFSFVPWIHSKPAFYQWG